MNYPADFFSRPAVADHHRPLRLLGAAADQGEPDQNEIRQIFFFASHLRSARGFFLTFLPLHRPKGSDLAISRLWCLDFGRPWPKETGPIVGRKTDR